jgi:SAM-dependent MidA family methyltransferase
MIETPLSQLISQRIKEVRAITFAEYMRMALYEPGYGYYVSGSTKVGWEGDFYTSTDVADFFANCMGRQLRQFWEQLERPNPFVVLEQGAGRAHLAQGVHKWAEQTTPDFATALEYHTEDIHTGQDARITQNNNAFTPHVLLSNELVDAFPVHIVEKYQGKLYEVYVTLQDGRLSEVLSKPSSEAVANYLDTYKVHWQRYEDGWRAEINLDAISWMQQASKLILGTRSRKRHGFLLTVDYGDKAGELYSSYRHRGTLACYYRHNMNEQPLLRPGQQDITAHVNFSALIDEGRRQGLHLQTYTTQRAWLTEMGIYDELARIRQRDFSIIDTQRASDQGQMALLQWYNLRQRASALTDPAGMGNFKVLIMKH